MGIVQNFYREDIHPFKKRIIYPIRIPPNLPHPNDGNETVPLFSPSLNIFNIFNKEKKYELYL